jgi:hypothetical protein
MEIWLRWLARKEIVNNNVYLLDLYGSSAERRSPENMCYLNVGTQTRSKRPSTLSRPPVPITSGVPP